MGFEVVPKLGPGDKGKGKAQSTEMALTIMVSTPKRFTYGYNQTSRTARLSRHAVRMLGGVLGEPFYVHWLVDRDAGKFGLKPASEGDLDAFRVNKSQTFSASSLFNVLLVAPGKYRLRQSGDVWVADPHIVGSISDHNRNAA